MQQTRKIASDLPESPAKKKDIKLNPPDSEGHTKHKGKRNKQDPKTTSCDRMTIGDQKRSQLAIREMVD